MEQLTKYIAAAINEGFQEGMEPMQPETDNPEEELEEDEFDGDDEDEFDDDEEDEAEEELESESEESTPSE